MNLYRSACCIGFATLLSFVCALQVQAQVTAQSLLQTSVEQIGPEHREVADAIEQFKKGAFLECRNLLKSAREKDDKLPPDGVLMARMLFTANQPQLARAELERTVKEDPSDPEPYLMFGELAFNQRRYADAELSFKKSYDLIQEFSSNPFRKRGMAKRALSGLAGVAETREDWAAAAKFLQPIVSADPKDATNTTRLARAMFEQDTNLGDAKGKEADAYKLLNQLWEGDKSTRRPEITMGSMYQNAGKKAISASLMKQASDRDTESLPTQLTVARWALGVGDNDLATACVTRAQKIAPTNVEAKLVAGLAARYRKDYPTARRVLEAAHLQSPSNLAAILQLAVVLAESGAEADQRTAMEYSQMASRIYSDVSQPTGREAAVTSAWVLHRAGRTDDALRILQKTLAGGQVSAESSYYAAQILHQNNPEVAKQLLTRALKGDGVFPARGEAEALLNSIGG